MLIYVISVLYCFYFYFFIFFFNDTATTEIYTLSTRRSSDLVILEPIVDRATNTLALVLRIDPAVKPEFLGMKHPRRDRKSTRLNSSHLGISYAVFCLKKKKQIKTLNLNNINNNKEHHI